MVQPIFVTFIPDQLKQGKLYISKLFGTAIHLCCCGCGIETITPLKEGFWQLSANGELVSLHPSIGNQDFECQSHYWIKNNQVRWVG